MNGWTDRSTNLTNHSFVRSFVCLFIHLSVCRSVCSFVSWLVDPHGRLLCCSSVVVVVVCLSCFCLLLCPCSIVLVGVSCGPGGFQHRRDGLPVPMPGWPLPSVPSSWLLHVWLHRDTKLCGGNNQCGCLPTSLQKSQTLCALARNHHGDVSVLVGARFKGDCQSRGIQDSGYVNKYPGSSELDADVKDP